MRMLNQTSIPNSVSGQTQLYEICATMAGLDKDFDGSNVEAVAKLIQCSEVAIDFFSVKLSICKFAMKAKILFSFSLL